MTSIRREPTNRLDTLMCVCFLGLHDASYTEVSSHLLASQQFQCPLDIGPVTGRGSINREGRSIQQTPYLRLGSSPDKQIRQPIHASVSLLSSRPDLLSESFRQPSI